MQLLAYSRRGWPVFPVTATKKPLTEHGLLDATTDEKQIVAWWKRWPHALAAMATGEKSGIIAVDVDIRPGVHGPDSLEALGVSFHLTTPTAHTPSGGFHMLLGHPGPGVYVKTIAGKLGPGLDIRGDGGSLILPPGPGRWWDPHLGPDTPLAPMPEWMEIPELEPPRVAPSQASRPVGELSPYCEAALDSARQRAGEC